MTRTITFPSAAAAVLLSTGCGHSSPTTAAALLALKVDPVTYLENPKLRTATLKECKSGTESEQVKRMRLQACVYAVDVEMSLEYASDEDAAIGRTR